MPKKATVDEVRESLERHQEGSGEAAAWRGIPAIPQLVPTHPWGPIHPPGRGKLNPTLPPGGKRCRNGEARMRKQPGGLGGHVATPNPH